MAEAGSHHRHALQVSVVTLQITCLRAKNTYTHKSDTQRGDKAGRWVCIQGTDQCGIFVSDAATVREEENSNIRYSVYRLILSIQKIWNIILVLHGNKVAGYVTF